MIRVLLLAMLAIWSRNVLCGRFNLTRPKDVVERFGFMDWTEKRIEPRFNIAPSQEILTIVQEPLGKPFAQTALTAGRRWRIPATGFFEWRALAPKQRQAMHIQRKDGGVFAFAGLWLP